MNMLETLNHLRQAKRGRGAMTRIVVSLLSDVQQGHVDISELRKLSAADFSAMASLVAWVASNPQAKIGDEEAARLCRSAESCLNSRERKQPG